MKPQEAALLLDSPGGNLERRMEAMMKVRQFPWRRGIKRGGLVVCFFFQDVESGKLWKGKGKEETYQISSYHRPSSSGIIDKQDTAELSNNGNNRRDALVFERLAPGDSNLRENRRRVVLNCRDASHLHGSLNRHGEEQSAEGGSVSEEFDV